MSTDAHVEALWWLLTTPGYNKFFYKPGDPSNCRVRSGTRIGYGLELGHPATSTVRTFQAETREELLDQIVAVMVEDKLAPQQKDPFAHLTQLSKLTQAIHADIAAGKG